MKENKLENDFKDDNETLNIIEEYIEKIIPEENESKN